MQAFTTVTSVCYTGVPATAVNGTIGDCCTASAARGSKESLHLFNYFASVNLFRTSHPNV